MKDSIHENAEPAAGGSAINDLVERVAEAIWGAVRYTESYPPIDMIAAKDAARAAIEAMREPTDAMADAALFAQLETIPQAKWLWRAMIDAALHKAER